MKLPNLCKNCDATLQQIINAYKTGITEDKSLKECSINALDYDQKNKSCIQYFFKDSYEIFK